MQGSCLWVLLVSDRRSATAIVTGCPATFGRIGFTDPETGVIEMAEVADDTAAEARGRDLPKSGNVALKGRAPQRSCGRGVRHRSRRARVSPPERLERLCRGPRTKADLRVSAPGHSGIETTRIVPECAYELAYRDWDRVPSGRIPVVTSRTFR
jgi:hypothetical protein